MVDNLVILAYIVVVLYVGYTCRKLSGFREFAIARGDYGWLAIFCTLAASFIGGGFSTGNAAKVFASGMAYPVAMMGFSLQIILVALFVAPRVKSFPGAVSVGDLIEPAYGRPARVITGLFAMLICGGILGAQIGALGAVFKVFLGVPPLVGILTGSAIIFFYSTVGGMAAVVKTDIVQFCLLILATPLLFVLGVHACGGWPAFVARIPASHLEVIGSHMTLRAFVSLFLVFLLGETLVPPYVQRLLIGRTVAATVKGNLWSGVVSVPFFLITGALGLVALQLDPDMAANHAMPEVVKRVAPVGVSGLIIAGVISIVMSSADSFLNAASVALVQDVIKPLRTVALSDRQNLLIARVANLLTGAIAMVFALKIPNVLDILIAAYDYWAPTVLIPLVAVLLGWRVSRNSFYAAALAGVIGMLVWSRGLGNPGGVHGLVVGTGLSLAAFAFANGLQRLGSPAGSRDGRLDRCRTPAVTSF